MRRSRRRCAADSGGADVAVSARARAGHVCVCGGGKQFRKLGAILGGMTPSHKARIKLMVLLGAGAGMEKIRDAFEGN